MDKELEAKVFEALGAASMCWSETPSGVFESTKAEQIGLELCSEIEKRLPSEAAPFQDKMTFREMLTNLFSTDFLSAAELDTIVKAGEMYANGCVRAALASEGDGKMFTLEEMRTAFCVGFSHVYFDIVEAERDFFKDFHEINLLPPSPQTK